MSLSTSPQADDKDYRELSFWHENLPHSLAARPALAGCDKPAHTSTRGGGLSPTRLADHASALRPGLGHRTPAANTCRAGAGAGRQTMSLNTLYDLPAPAKVNAFLHVVGRRADGYHLLQSVVVLIDWHDTLHIESRADGKLLRNDLTTPLPADDLCLRAAHALQLESGSGQGAVISIDKRIPTGAGMGGGSSDAATTLLALNQLWRLHWPRSRLLALGLSLGADVPFFLSGSNAFMEGVGERLTALDIPQQWLAVVKPAANTQTGTIYESPLLTRNTDAVILDSLLARGSWASRSKTVSSSQAALLFGRNDLQRPAVSQYVEIGQAAQWLENQFGNARMTGSGSAVFAWAGAVQSAGTSTQPTVTMPEVLPPGWLGRMCRSLEQHPLRGWAPD